MDEILQSIQRIIAEDERSSPKRADDIFELTEALNEDGTIRHLAPIGGAPKRVEPEPVHPPLIPPTEARLEPVREQPPLSAVRDIPEAEPTIAVVSGGALSAPISAPLEPMIEPRIEPEPPRVPAAARTLDDIAAELLRPMLKAWLDEHLPSLVERIVREEAARATEKTQAAAS